MRPQTQTPKGRSARAGGGRRRRQGWQAGNGGTGREEGVCVCLPKRGAWAWAWAWAERLACLPGGLPCCCCQAETYFAANLFACVCAMQIDEHGGRADRLGLRPRREALAPGERAHTTALAACLLPSAGARRRSWGVWRAPCAVPCRAVPCLPVNVFVYVSGSTRSAREG